MLQQLPSQWTMSGMAGSHDHALPDRWLRLQICPTAHTSRADTAATALTVARVPVLFTPMSRSENDRQPRPSQATTPRFWVASHIDVDDAPESCA